MAGSVNKVILLGNLGKDPEIRHFEGGRSVANFPLATTDSYKDKNGDRQEQTEWHNVVIWRAGLVGIVEKYLKKGNKVYLEGRLRTRSWEDQNQNMRYTTEVLVENLTLLGGAPNAEGGGAPAASNPAPATSASPQNKDEDLDDLPF